jgi:hypothetical protein
MKIKVTVNSVSPIASDCGGNSGGKSGTCNSSSANRQAAKDGKPTPPLSRTR